MRVTVYYAIKYYYFPFFILPIERILQHSQYIELGLAPANQMCEKWCELRRYRDSNVWFAMLILSAVTTFQREMAPSTWVLEEIQQGVEPELTSEGHWHERNKYLSSQVNKTFVLLLQHRITYSGEYKPGAKAFTKWGCNKWHQQEGVEQNTAVRAELQKRFFFFT